MAEQTQPKGTQEMSQTPAQKPSLIHDYSSGVAKEAGKQTVEYVAQNPDTTQVIDNMEVQAQQKYDQAKAEAQGMWAKLFGCFSSVE